MQVRTMLSGEISLEKGNSLFRLHGAGFPKEKIPARSIVGNNCKVYRGNLFRLSPY